MRWENPNREMKIESEKMGENLECQGNFVGILTCLHSVLIILTTAACVCVRAWVCMPLSLSWIFDGVKAKNSKYTRILHKSNWRNEQWLWVTVAVMLYIYICSFGSVSSSLPFDPNSWQLTTKVFTLHNWKQKKIHNSTLSVDRSNQNFSI